MSEQWRPVLGWEGLYEVSDTGRVRVLEHTTVSAAGITRNFPARELKLTTSTSGGYQQVHLSRSRKRITAHVHVLVLEALVGPRPPQMFGCHNDGNPTHNSADNLRWDTPSSNAVDAVRHGTNRHIRATHCKNGHPKNPENTYTDYLGRRICHPCNKAWHRRARAARKAAA